MISRILEAKSLYHFFEQKHVISELYNITDPAGSEKVNKLNIQKNHSKLKMNHPVYFHTPGDQTRIGPY